MLGLGIKKAVFVMCIFSSLVLSYLWVAVWAALALPSWAWFSELCGAVRPRVPTGQEKEGTGRARHSLLCPSPSWAKWLFLLLFLPLSIEF